MSIFKFTVLQLLFLINLNSVSAFYRVDSKTKFIKDSFGRSVIFHGVNAVVKVPPYVPMTDVWDVHNSLSELDLKYLNTWGLNVVRLGVMWPGVMPEAHKVNTTYLQVTKDLIRRMAEYNISVIIDCHQDLFSPWFCGDGVPDYAINFGNHTTCFPKPVQDTIGRDPKGYPLPSDCFGKRPWFNWYFSYDVCRAFQSLYTNPGTQQYFMDFWSTVSQYFKDEKNILGYELLNEPWMGDVYTHPGDLLPEYTERNLLQPLYDKLFEVISKHDENHIVFFEAVPAVSEMTPSGYTHGPGGPNQTERQVWSYHMYCPISGENGKPLCTAWDTVSHDTATADAKRLGNAAMMTEFGSMDSSPSSIVELNTLMGLADKTIHSWTYWTYKDYGFNGNGLSIMNQRNVGSINEDYGGATFFYNNGTVQKDKVATLSRTYAQAIAGVPHKMTYEPNTKEFILEYTSNPNIREPTIIYLNSEWNYPKGFTTSLVPSHGYEVRKVTNNSIYILCVNCVSELVKFTITSN